MKIAVWILWLAIVAQLTGGALYIALFCYGPDGLEPVDIESVITVALALTGITLGALLIRAATHIRPVYFWLWFVLYLFAFAIPGIVGAYYMFAFYLLGA